MRRSTGSAQQCVMCDREFLRDAADVYFENEHFVYASSVIRRLHQKCSPDRG